MNITQSDLEQLVTLTQKASHEIMAIYDSDSAIVEWKSDNSPLTQADKISHEIIVSGLEKLFPDIPVVSEEGSQTQNQAMVASPRFWLVDPIDGTQDFVNRTGEFCIAIGLIENNKPTFGFVAAPTFGVVYYGGPRMGSYKKIADDEPLPIHVKNLDPHIVAISRTHPSETTMAYIEENFPGSQHRQLGSMLKQMKLAEGEVDVYASINQPLHLWDAAAGNAIIEGAGGIMTRLDGSALDYSAPNLLVGDFVARAKNY